MRRCLSGLGEAETNAPVVNRIHLTNQQAGGARSALLPDAIVRWTSIAPPAQIDSPLIGSLKGRLSNGRRGNHRSDCFLITMGPGFEHGSDAPRLHIKELSPIVLQRLLDNESGAPHGTAL